MLGLNAVLNVENISIFGSYFSVIRSQGIRSDSLHMKKIREGFTVENLGVFFLPIPDPSVLLKCDKSLAVKRLT